MGSKTKIAWADSTFSPWWGCQRVSEGCVNCYAETFSKRVGLKVWGANSDRRIFGDKHWYEPRKWNAKAAATGQPHRVFCSSMADVFEDRRDLDPQRARLFALIEETPALTWMLLTKRPENMRKLTPDSWGGGLHAREESPVGRWPANVWAGCTAENQVRLDERVPWLLEVPAVVRFLSCEPLLEALDLENVEPYYLKRDKHPYDPKVRVDCLRGHVKGPDDMLDEKIAWVIAGAESGHGRRPMQLDWVRTLRDQCVGAETAFLFKQTVDELGVKTELPELDGKVWAQFPEAQ